MKTFDRWIHRKALRLSYRIEDWSYELERLLRYFWHWNYLLWKNHHLKNEHGPEDNITDCKKGSCKTFHKFGKHTANLNVRLNTRKLYAISRYIGRWGMHLNPKE